MELEERERGKLMGGTGLRARNASVLIQELWWIGF
jgi:hypothetical protein